MLSSPDKMVDSDLYGQQQIRLQQAIKKGRAGQQPLFGMTTPYYIHLSDNHLFESLQSSFNQLSSNAKITKVPR